MTDKQIIIDGVDVSGCPYAEPAYKTPKCRINYYIHCDGHNCHYKKWQRKEQECKDLKKINKKLKHSFKELNVYIEKAQEWLKKQKSNDIFIDEMKAILLEELKCSKKK